MEMTSKPLDSEEIKYRQKCKDLKKRVREVEDNNKYLTVRISRAKRALQRIRLERAFLLEKLEERTLVKIDDEDGLATLAAQVPGDVSPSPPLSPLLSSLKHRPQTESRSNSPESKSHQHHHHQGDTTPGPAGAGGTPGPSGSTTKSKANKTPRDPNAPKRPLNAYILFCDKEKERVRRELERSKPNPGGYDLTRAMAEAWKELGSEGRGTYYELYESEKTRYAKEMETYNAANAAAAAAAAAASATATGTSGNEPPVKRIKLSHNAKKESSPSPAVDEPPPAVSSPVVPPEVASEGEEQKTEPAENSVKGEHAHHDDTASTTKAADQPEPEPKVEENQD